MPQIRYSPERAHGRIDGQWCGWYSARWSGRTRMATSMCSCSTAIPASGSSTSIGSTTGGIATMSLLASENRFIFSRCLREFLFGCRASTRQASCLFHSMEQTAKYSASFPRHSIPRQFAGKILRDRV